MDVNERITSSLQSWLDRSTNHDKELLLQVMEGIDTKNRNSLHTYISALMGMEKEATGEASIRISMDNTPLLSNSLGILHGGLTSTLIDSAMGTAANMNLSENEGAVTLDLNVRFLAPGTGRRFFCDASVIKSGRQIIVTEATVTNEKNVVIASATGTFFKIKR